MIHRWFGHSKYDRAEGLTQIGIGYSMFCVGYGIYTRERSSRVYIS